MEREFTAAKAAEHERLWRSACLLVNGELHIDGQPVPGHPGLRAKIKLKRATRLFERVLKINPENGAAMFFLARIHLRFGDKERCLGNLLRAQELMPESPGVARESVMVAIQLKDLDRAIDLGQSAVKRLPEDGGLRVNLGLALLLNGRAAEAAETFRAAAQLEPEDLMTPKLALLANRVANGDLPCPISEPEVVKAITSPYQGI